MYIGLGILAYGKFEKVGYAQVFEGATTCGSFLSCHPVHTNFGYFLGKLLIVDVGFHLFHDLGDEGARIVVVVVIVIVEGPFFAFGGDMFIFACG